MSCCCSGGPCCYPESLPETLHVQVTGTGNAAQCSATFDVVFVHTPDDLGRYSWRGTWMHAGASGAGPQKTCFWYFAGGQPGTGLYGLPVAGCLVSFPQTAEANPCENNLPRPAGNCAFDPGPLFNDIELVSCHPLHLRATTQAGFYGLGACPCGSFPYIGQTLTFDLTE